MSGLSRQGLNRSLSRSLGGSLLVNPTAGTPYSPTTLFAGGEEGFFFDVSDLSTVWEDSAGTVPASVDGPVGRVTDKSGRGRNVTQGTTANKPTLRTGGGLYWLEFDGVDDHIATVSFASVGAGPHAAGVAIYPTSLTGSQKIIDQDGLVAANRVANFIRLNGAAPTASAFNNVPTSFTDSAANLTISTAAVVVESTTPSAVEVWNNGASNGSTAVTGTLQTTAGLVRLGARQPDASTEKYTGRLYAAVLLARALTAGERASLQTYLGTKNGVVL
jgi:hypothetical protein